MGLRLGRTPRRIAAHVSALFKFVSLTAVTTLWMHTMISFSEQHHQIPGSGAHLSDLPSVAGPFYEWRMQAAPQQDTS